MFVVTSNNCPVYRWNDNGSVPADVLQRVPFNIKLSIFKMFLFFDPHYILLCAGNQKICPLLWEVNTWLSNKATKRRSLMQRLTTMTFRLSWALQFAPENEWLTLNGGEKVCDAFQISGPRKKGRRLITSLFVWPELKCVKASCKQQVKLHY